MIKADVHMHTNFSSDSTADMEDMVKKGIELGLSILCFTDHMDYDFPTHYNIDFTFHVPDYWKKIEELREKYKNQIIINMGIELGLQPKLAGRYRQLIKKYPFDYIIGSTHLVDNLDPYCKEFWKVYSEEEGYQKYFQTILANMKSFDEFDSYGHIDYVVRYGPNQNKNYSYEKYSQILEQILKMLISKGKALEVNTGGYKYGLGQPHPQTDVLRRYKEMGGERITIGSDAHEPQYMAYDFKKTKELLLSLGFQYYTVYQNRIPQFISLK